MKNNLPTIITTAIVSAAITATAIYTFGLSEQIEEPTNISSQEEHTPEACGEPLTIQVKDAGDDAWETVTSEVAGFSLQVPKEYGWTWVTSPTAGKFNGLTIVKDEGSKLPQIKVNNIEDAPANDAEEIIAVQPIVMEQGEGKKVTFVYGNEERGKQMGAYYLFGHKGKTYKITKFNHTPWELFDDVAKTFQFSEIEEPTK